MPACRLNYSCISSWTSENVTAQDLESSSLKQIFSFKRSHHLQSRQYKTFRVQRLIVFLLFLLLLFPSLYFFSPFHSQMSGFSAINLVIWTQFGQMAIDFHKPGFSNSSRTFPPKKKHVRIILGSILGNMKNVDWQELCFLLLHFFSFFSFFFCSVFLGIFELKKPAFWPRLSVKWLTFLPIRFFAQPTFAWKKFLISLQY